MPSINSYYQESVLEINFPYDEKYHEKTSSTSVT